MSDHSHGGEWMDEVSVNSFRQEKSGEANKDARLGNYSHIACQAGSKPTNKPLLLFYSSN